ncbi:hypothetical protein [Gulosibacter sp. 10]|uniref:hypothetical protein n=1 Tax=Gulosibacter sp. 10 TaxID=1255570 RepID=UPI00097EF748|nr:hypothetical protein [Gulosibacter sp. 10]SJM48558.1 hypothetical protein FM112_00580 [Gulosibacter sp. 10]
MKRVLFIVGAGVGFVLGARAGRERYEQIKGVACSVAESAPARRAVAIAQQGADLATDGLARLTGKVSASSREFESRIVHTTESLRADLRRRMDDTRTSIDDARLSAREWVDQAKERSIELQAQNVMAVGEQRAEALADLEDEGDLMVDEGGADRRNERE